MNSLDFIAFLIFTFLILPFAKALMDCKTADSCKGDGTNCYCDKNCEEYRECCPDKPLKMPPSVNSGPNPYICKATGLNQNIFIKAKCPKNWQNDFILTSCQDKTDLEEDIVKSWRVFDTNTNITYLNVYCAICNGAIVSNLKSWKKIINCASSPEILARDKNVKLTNSATFNVNLNSWQKLQIDAKSGKKFTVCKASVAPDSALPEYLPNYRPCKPYLTYSCPGTWKNKDIALKCVDGPALYRYIPDTLPKVYRNKYCAICNGVEESSLTCVLENWAYVGDAAFATTNPLTVKFSFNFSNEKGKLILNLKCPNGQLFHPNEKKCIDLACNYPKINPFLTCSE